MILGIDIGGTTVKIGVVKNNKIEKKYSIPTNPLTLVDDIIDSFDKNNIDLENIKAIGVAIPGLVEHEKGIVKWAGNLSYENIPIKEMFENKLTCPIFVLNDANAAALGEYWVGAGKEYDSIILYTLGTGVGGGVVLNNKLEFGSNGFAGEFGHGGYFQDERKCNCGLNNCMEPMSSALGIEKTIYEITGKKLELKNITNLFLEKDQQIIEAFTKSLTPLAKHIATLCSAINPDAVLIGGGPSNYGQPLADFINGLVKKYQMPPIYENTKLLIAKTSNDAGILGAAYWAITGSSKK